MGLLRPEKSPYVSYSGAGCRPEKPNHLYRERKTAESGGGMDGKTDKRMGRRNAFSALVYIASPDATLRELNGMMKELEEPEGEGAEPISVASPSEGWQVIWMLSGSVLVLDISDSQLEAVMRWAFAFRRTVPLQAVCMECGEESRVLYDCQKDGPVCDIASWEDLWRTMHDRALALEGA